MDGIMDMAPDGATVEEEDSAEVADGAEAMEGDSDTVLRLAIVLGRDCQEAGDGCTPMERLMGFHIRFPMDTVTTVDITRIPDHTARLFRTIFRIHSTVCSTMKEKH